LTGVSHGNVDFGGGPVPGNTSDVFVAKYDASGNLLFAKAFGDQDVQQGQGVAFDSTGGVAITGWYRGTVDFGGGPLTTVGDSMFLARFDGSGNHLWSKSFGGNGGMTIAYAVAVDGGGFTYLVGEVEYAIDFGGGPLPPVGNREAVVGKFDAAGNHVWSKRFGDADIQVGMDVAVDAASNVYLAGLFYGSIALGGPALTSAGGADAFLAKLDAAGNHVWSKRFGDGGSEAIIGIACDPSGGLAVAGVSDSVVDLGGGPLTSGGATDVFVARISTNGVHLWSTLYGGPDHQMIDSVALDPAGNVLVTGNYLGSIDFAGSAFYLSNGFTDGYLAKWNASGVYLWSKTFGDAVAQSGLGVGADGMGRVVLGGLFEGTISFGGPPLTTTGVAGFLALFTP
jgi:hypothetical protein